MLPDAGDGATLAGNSQRLDAIGLSIAFMPSSTHYWPARAHGRRAPWDDSRRRAQGKAGAVESAVQSLEGQRQRATASTSGLARVATRPAASGLAKKSVKSASPVARPAATGRTRPFKMPI